jgi:hypothetical protein
MDAADARKKIEDANPASAAKAVATDDELAAMMAKLMARALAKILVCIIEVITKVNNTVVLGTAVQRTEGTPDVKPRHL